MDAQERFTNINESYKYSGSGTLYFTEGKRDKTGAAYEETTAIANHAPILKERRIIDNGIETSEELVYRAFRGGKSGPATGITLKDLYSQTPQMKFGAACRIYPGKGAVTRYRECMQMQCEDFPETTVYQHTGYTMIDGERIFLNGGHSVTRDGLTSRYNVDLPGPLGLYGFTERKDEGRYKTLLSVLPAVAPAPLVYAGLGVAFLSPLNRLLREIGLEPMFVLYFTGKTGSGKSTFARLLLNFFGDYDKSAPPPASFNDTPNALEMKLALTDSTLVLADDRIPSTTPAIRAKMETMEQRIVRMIGERVGRGRLNADSTMKTVYRPVEDGFIETSPMQRMKYPKPRKDEAGKGITVYDAEQVKYILQCAEQEPLKWRAFIMLALDTGCRKGEIVGLKWSDIDFKTGRVTISRNVQYTNGSTGIYVTTPKTGKARTITINPPALRVLAEWKREQLKAHAKQCIPIAGWVFTQDSGEVMHPNAPVSYMVRFGKRYNLPGIHCHALRHTMASLAITNGADAVSVSEKLGHAKPSITLDVYSHANEESQKRANEILASVIYEQKQA